jgi:hypothetical protein
MRKFGQRAKETELLVTVGPGELVRLGYARVRYTDPDVAPNGTMTVNPLPGWRPVDNVVPTAPGKTICGTPPTLPVRLTVICSPAVAALGVIEVNTRGVSTQIDDEEPVTVGV